MLHLHVPSRSLVTSARNHYTICWTILCGARGKRALSRRRYIWRQSFGVTSLRFVSVREVNVEGIYSANTRHAVLEALGPFLSAVVNPEVAKAA